MDIIGTYLIPIRTSVIDHAVINEFYDYWEELGSWNCEVLVIDGSPQEVFETHARKWTNCRHIKVDPKFTYLNGKVNGILTGVPMAKHEKIILADDDIRYTKAGILQILKELENYDMVRPQNYFSPNPLRARIDSARILLNRSVFRNGDFPGTFGFLKSRFMAAGEFDGDVLFDNEELVRHFENCGAQILYATDFFVLRIPPTSGKWLEQRPRQAYEDFVMRYRTLFFLLVIPVHLWLLFKGKRKVAGVLAMSIAVVSVIKAFKGREKGAQKFFSAKTAFHAPLWILERSISIYLALYWKITKGGYPFGDKIISKGTGRAWKGNRND